MDHPNLILSQLTAARSDQDTKPLKVATSSSPRKRVEIMYMPASEIGFMLVERTLELTTSDPYSDFFKDIYNFLYNFEYDLKEDLFDRIFCESIYGSELTCLSTYCIDFFKAISTPEKIDRYFIKRFHNFFEKVKIPLELADVCRMSLIKILNENTQIITNYRGTPLHTSLIRALGILAKKHEDNWKFFVSCREALLTHYVRIFLHKSRDEDYYLAHALGAAVQTVCEIDRFLTTDFELVSKMLNDSDYHIRRVGIQQFTFLAVQHQQAFLTNMIEHNVAIKKLCSTDPYKEMIQYKSKPFTFDELFEVKLYLEVITKLSCDEYFIKNLMNYIDSCLNIDGCNLCFFSDFMHHFSIIHPSIAERSCSILYKLLQNPLTRFPQDVARELTKLICKTNISFKPYFEMAFDLLNEPLFEKPAREVLAHYRIHMELSNHEKQKCFDALLKKIECETDLFFGDTHPVINMLKTLVHKEGEPKEIKSNCIRLLLQNLKHPNYRVNNSSMIALSELGSQIESYGFNFWNDCIVDISRCTDNNHRCEAIGNFALCCRQNAVIVDACAKKIFQLIKGCHSIRTTTSEIKGLLTLMRLPCISMDNLKESLRQAFHLLYDDSCSQLIQGLREAAQVWHNDIEKFDLIFSEIKRILPRYVSLTFKELHILAETPGLAYEIKKNCYLAIFEALKNFNHPAAQECVEASLKNNSLSQELIIAYLERCIPLLTYKDRKKYIINRHEQHAPRLGFVNVCLYYEKHPDLITEEIKNLLKKGKNYFTEYPAKSLFYGN